MFYSFSIIGGALVIAVSNFIKNQDYSFQAFCRLVFITANGVIAVILIDGLFAFICRRLPEKWFLPEAKAFTVGNREHKFYKKIKIDRWKKHVPEWGCFTGFRKDRMRQPNDVTYIGRFLLESNYGVLGHVTGAIFGFTIMIFPNLPTFTVALPIAVINCFLSLLPTMILRYNTPALRRIYRRNLARLDKK